jgi:hypothetical protein
LYPATESLASDIPAGNGEIDNLFLQCIDTEKAKPFKYVVYCKPYFIEEAKEQGLTAKLTFSARIMGGPESIIKTTGARHPPPPRPVFPAA